jgi:hypothetical protein
MPDVSEAPVNPALPLAGIRVVDLTRVLSRPFCSMLLGDLGADIIKVETPGEGDAVRHQGAGRDGLSWYFANYNRNKRSITLNLRSEEGHSTSLVLPISRMLALCSGCHRSRSARERRLPSGASVPRCRGPTSSRRTRHPR